MNPSGPLPPYVQIANVLRNEIRAGQYPAESKLPSALALVERFKVSGQTVNNAVRVLREEGTVFTTQRGTFVRAGEPGDEAPSAAYTDLMGQLDSMTEAITDLRERMEQVEEALRQQAAR